MNWDLMKKLELLFEKYGIKPVLGLIPIALCLLIEFP